MISQVLWRTARAKIRAESGDTEGAEALAREAVRLAEATELLNTQGDALLDLASVLARGLDARMRWLPPRRLPAASSRRATVPRSHGLERWHASSVDTAGRSDDIRPMTKPPKASRQEAPREEGHPGVQAHGRRDRRAERLLGGRVWTSVDNLGAALMDDGAHAEQKISAVH